MTALLLDRQAPVEPHRVVPNGEVCSTQVGHGPAQAGADAMIRAMATTRLIAVEDAPPLADLLELNREFLAPWEPIRADEYFTEGGQRRAIEEALQLYDETTSVPHVILEHGQVVGRVTVSNIVRGPFQ
jgi:hypothetical protein